MRVVIQRCLESSVSVHGEVVGSITSGLTILVGVTHEDTPLDVAYCARKISQMRLFEDNEGKTNLSLSDIGGSILSVSQFTLYASTKKGNRPSFTHAAPPQMANELYLQLNEALRDEGFHVEEGRFGEDMEVRLINDGPVTIILDSHQRDF